MAASEASAAAQRTYGNWQKPASSGILGLGSLGTVILFIGLVLAVLVTMAAGLLRGLITGVILAVVLATILIKDRHGRNLLDRGITRIGWASATRRGANLYTSGPLGFALWGTNQLPGIAAQLRLSEHKDAYGRPFALVHAPSTGTYTAIIGTEPDGAGLVDAEQVDVWVADWGHWLASLGDEPGIEACSVTIETAPDTGHRLRREVDNNIDPHAPEFAQTMLREVVQEYPAGSSVVKAYVTLTFNAASSATGRRREPEEMGRDLAARLPALTGSLAATGAGGGHLMDAAELCETIRVAYDPAMAVHVDEAHAQGTATDLAWSDVGPAAAQAGWDHYLHDGAVSVTWSMTNAPRGNVQASVLSRLLSPHPDVARKRVTMLYRPIDAARAAAIVESDLRSAEFVASAAKKPTARAILATRAAGATAAEEASGAGLVNFAMLVTATVTDPAGLPKARAAIDNLAPTARIRLRPAYGAQSAAFAAALPLGLVLPKHVKGPAAFRDRL